jgi:hypothetical protein
MARMRVTALRMYRGQAWVWSGSGVNYILEVVEQVCDRLALRVGQDIIVVDFRSVGRAAEEQLSTEVAHCVGRGLASRRCRGGPVAMGSARAASICR